ncbi:MAG: cytochrome c [Spirochaetaceae bacterium]|nr:cytochrome c [Spirochaetaceae bacterium]
MSKRVLTMITVTALAAAVALAAAGIFLRQNREPAWADAGAPDLVARGRIVYQQSCAACHGARLEGQPNWRQPNADGTLPAPPHDVTGHTWHHPDQMLFDITKYGSASVAGAGFKSAMPVYDGVLDDADIWAVLAFIKSHWPPDIQAAQSARSGDTRR